MEEALKNAEKAKQDAKPKLEELAKLKEQLMEGMRLDWVKQTTVQGMPVEVGMMKRGVINIACRDKAEAEMIVNILLPLLNK